MLRDAHFLPTAARPTLGGGGGGGGRAGRRCEVVAAPGGPGGGVAAAPADAEPVRAGEVIRIRTTGGGGWGDPLRRDPELVVRDVRWHKVSVAGALADYGVVVTGAVEADDLAYDTAATQQRRAEQASGRGERPFFDRGPGYERLSGGARAAEVDWL